MFGTDHGLCGRFNEQVAKRVFNHEFDTPVKHSHSLKYLVDPSNNSGQTHLLVVGHVLAEVCKQNEINS